MSQTAANDLPTGTPRRYFWNLTRWCWTYIRGHKPALIAALVSLGIALACQAAIPLVITDILTPPTGGLGALSLLAALIIAQIGLGNLGQKSAFTVANQSCTDLRRDVFAGLLATRYLQQPRLFRSSVVSRHTHDVDNIGTAIETTIVAGIPGAVQVVISLALLTYVDLWAGVAMLVVTAGFIVARARVGRTLLAADRQRLDASSQVGELVDESISMATPLAGLRLEKWHIARFETLSRRLEVATRLTNEAVNRLISIGEAAGLIGLFAIMVFASLAGTNEIALIAAAMLYINIIVTGLAKMPPWVRHMQLAVVSRRRIDQILHGAEDSPVVRDALAVPTWRSLAAQGDVPRGLVGLVAQTSADEDFMLTAFTGTDDEADWRVSLFGRIVRQAGVRPDIVHIPDEPAAFNVGVRDHLRAVQPGITDDQIAEVLSAVGLAHLLDLDEPLGQGGSRLTSMDRQRLLLAIAICAQPRVLVVGALTPLADIDTANALLNALRSCSAESVVIAVRSPEVAAEMDVIMHLTDDEILIGSHTELLASQPQYSRIWSQKVLGHDVDLGSLGIPEESQESLHARLVTEHFPPGDVIYRQGDPADRVLFIISGHVEVSVDDRRVATLGPGNHCGDLTLSSSQARAETAVAVDDCVVRSLSRYAFASGIMGWTSRPRTQRRVVAEVLRTGGCTTAELATRLGEDPVALEESVAALVRDGVLRTDGDMLKVASWRRTPNRGAAHLHDRLLDL